MRKVHLRHGALAPPLREQLVKQGVPLPADFHLDFLQKRADAITTLVMSELLTGPEAMAARKRLNKRLLGLVQHACSQEQGQETMP